MRSGEQTAGGDVGRSFGDKGKVLESRVCLSDSLETISGFLRRLGSVDCFLKIDLSVNSR